MSNCQCTNIPTSVPCVEIPYATGCNNIRMFFGYSTDPNLNNKVIPGQLTDLFYTGEVISDKHVKQGFIVEDYSFQELVSAGVLPPGCGKGGNTNTFDLTETELLSTSSWETWLAWQTTRLLALSENELDLTSPNPSNKFRTFGFWVMKALEVDLKRLRADSVLMYASIRNGDTGGFWSKIQKFFTNFPKTSGYQTDRGELYPTQSELDINECDYLKRASDHERLLICYEWLKKIHDTYYGKQFLVRIGDSIPESTSPVSYPLDSICIKNQSGNYPSLSWPYYIDGDGSAQGYYLSDVIDNSGGFPQKEDKSIIGLSNLDWVQTENGKIGCFAQIGSYAELNSFSPCNNIYTQILYPKFQIPGSGTTDCAYWKMDISQLNEESYYLGKTLSPSTEQILYVSASASERIYVNDEGTWAHVVLADKIPLSPNAKSLAQAFYYYKVLSGQADNYLQDFPSPEVPESIFYSLVKNSFGVYGDVFDFLLKYTYHDNNIHGARPDTSILNLTNKNPPCLIPEAIAIPFKSNLYTYGPFFYGDGTAGGVDVVQDTDIVPWNFIVNGSGSVPVDYAYLKMEDYGKAIASAGPKDLQKLEKGRITVVGLPCYCMGYWVDDKNCYDANEIGPTLLTDISVEYGAGGFNTTYNFSTYSPRFGKPEKYITDAWKKNIKETQYLNQYLKSLRDNIDKNNQSYKLRLINGERGGLTVFPDKNSFFSPSPIMTYKSTTHQVMFAGYYLNITPTPDPDFIDYQTIESYPTITLPEAYPSGLRCACEDDTPLASGVEYTPPPSGHRFYAFAETDKAYSSEYMQNTYHQLSGMTLDGFFLPVSLRGANKDPKIKEYQKNDNSNSGPGNPPNQFVLVNGKLQKDNTWQNNARLPRFAMRCENDGSFIEWDAIPTPGITYDRELSNTPGYPIPSKTRDEIPPFKLDLSSGIEDCYALQINQRYLNPYLSEKNLLGANDPEDTIEGWDDRKNDSNRGFVISSIVFGQDYIDYQITHTHDNQLSDNEKAALNINEAQTTDEIIRQQFRNFRFPSLRGPLVLQGWGYDTTGKPIPNSADGWGHAQMGKFRKDGLTDKFMKNWLQNPKTWPVGPIDLRFDRERGVWTCPSPNKIVVARLKERLSPYGSATAELINPTANGVRFYEHYSISGPNGENVKLNMTKTEIQVYDFLGVELCQCDIIYAYYDDNRYIVLESNRAYKDHNEECKEIECTTTAVATTPTPPCDWCGLECLQTLEGYNPSAGQILGHDDNGCLKWFDIVNCT